MSLSRVDYQNFENVIKEINRLDQDILQAKLNSSLPFPQEAFLQRISVLNTQLDDFNKQLETAGSNKTPLNEVEKNENFPILTQSQISELRLKVKNTKKVLDEIFEPLNIRREIKNKIHSSLVNDEMLTKIFNQAGAFLIKTDNRYEDFTLAKNDIALIMADVNGETYRYRNGNTDSISIDWETIKKDIVCKFAVTETVPGFGSDLKTEEDVTNFKLKRGAYLEFASTEYDREKNSRLTNPLENVEPNLRVETHNALPFASTEYDRVSEIYKSLTTRLVKVESDILRVDTHNDPRASAIIQRLEKIEKIYSSTIASTDKIKQLDLETLNLYYTIRTTQGFFPSRLGNELEAIIKSKNGLNLIEKYQIKIPHKFTSDDQPYQRTDLISREIIAKPGTLKDYLINYISQREIEESRDNSRYHTFFGRLSDMSSTLKINAAKNMLKAIESNSDVPFTHDELVALKNGSLGKIIKQFESKLPKAYIEAVNRDSFNLSRIW